MISSRPGTAARPAVIGHRGASGHALENSAEAFRLAADLRHPAHCDAVELDVHACADGELIVHHDARLPSGERISDMSTRRVRASRLADGSAPLTLTEALAILGAVEVWIELKTLPPTSDDRLLATIAANGTAPCHVHAFDHRIVARIHAQAPALTCGVLSCSYPIDPVAQVVGAGAQVLWQAASFVDDDLVARCHAAGIGVVAWTANDPDEIKRLVALDVDGICGDWPERIRAAIASR